MDIFSTPTFPRPSLPSRAQRLAQPLSSSLARPPSTALQQRRRFVDYSSRVRSVNIYQRIILHALCQVLSLVGNILFEWFCGKTRGSVNIYQRREGLEALGLVNYVSSNSYVMSVCFVFLYLPAIKK